MRDFTDWNFQDHDGCFSITTDRISWHKVDRTIVRYIENQLEVLSDFTHTFDVCIKEGEVEDELNRGFIRLWEIRNDWENRTWIYIRKKGNRWTIHFEQLDQKKKLIEFHGSNRHQFNSRYSIEITRIGEVFRLKVRDEFGSIIEDSKEKKGKPKSYSNIWLASTIKSRRNNGNWSSGYIENLQIK
jgi:hypothetical protein